MVHFNDWLHTSHADNIPHAVQAPPYVGFLVPVQNSFLKLSGIMQVYGFAAGSHYTGGPYKAYRGSTYSHSSRFVTNGLDVSLTHDQYKIGSLNSAGVFEISIAHQRTVVARAITGRPNHRVHSLGILLGSMRGIRAGSFIVLTGAARSPSWRVGRPRAPGYVRDRGARCRKCRRRKRRPNRGRS